MSAERLSNADLQRIARLPLFNGLQERDMCELLAGVSAVRSESETTLFMQGDVASRFYLLLEGCVRLYVVTSEGEQGLVDTIRGCSSFAEAAVLAGGSYPVTAQAERGALLVPIEARIFLRQLSLNRPLAMQMLNNLHRWERLILDEIARMKLLSPAQRLAHFILSLRAEADAKGRLQLPISKGLLADRIGIKAESLSRALKRLRDLGVHCGGSSVTVRDWDLVQAFVNGPADEIVEDQDGTEPDETRLPEGYPWISALVRLDLVP